jgi:polyhydroxyalkanoate synthase
MESPASWSLFPPAVAGLLAEQQRLWRNLFHLPRAFGQACTTRVGSTPHDVVLEQGRWKLLRYRRETPATHAQPALFCYALINRPYILDLLPDRSVIGRYLERGFDVYLIDWGVPGDADRGVTLEDHVCGFLAASVAFILREHQRADLHLVGYCMGGTMAVLYTALEPAAVASITLLAAPIDFSGDEGLLELWTGRGQFDVDDFVDTHGNCPGWFLQSCFLAMKPVQNLIEKNLAFFEHLEDPEAITVHFAMERWLNENIPVAGETFREFVKRLYQGNELTRGRFSLGGRPIELGRIRCPLLLLTAARDHLVTPASTEGLRPHVGSSDIQSITIEAGHVGLVVGGKARKTMWPAATRWLAERSSTAPRAAA